MAVKKGALSNFLKPNARYSTNTEEIRSIFIEKNENDSKAEAIGAFEAVLLKNTVIKDEKNHSGRFDSFQPQDKSISESAVNRQQTDNKLATNRQQTGNKPTTNKEQESAEENISENMPESTKIKLATNRQQTGNKPATNWQQTGNKPTTNWQQASEIKNKTKRDGWETGNKLATEPTTELATNWQQTGNKLATNYPFSALTGLQREIVIFLYYECKNSRSKITEPITLEHLSTNLKCSKGTVKTTIQRLELKSCLIKNEFKNGRGGWSRYEIPEKLYHEILRKETDNKLATNWQQTGNKPTTEPATEPATTIPSSSSYIKTTTTSQSSSWTLDIEEFKKFGFNQSHLSQVISMGLKEEDVKQSLAEFSYDFDNKHLPRIQTSPINLLMGLFRKGQVYTSSHFQSEEEKAIQEMVKRAEERKKKMLDAKFMLWFHELSEEEKQNIQNDMMPSTRQFEISQGLSNPFVKGHYLKYFMEKENN